MFHLILLETTHYLPNVTNWREFTDVTVLSEVKMVLENLSDWNLAIYDRIESIISDHRCPRYNKVAENCLTLRSSSFTTSSGFGESSNFRQEIRQSYYRNDPVKYDLRELVSRINIRTRQRDDSSVETNVLWFWDRIEIYSFKTTPSDVLASAVHILKLERYRED